MAKDKQTCFVISPIGSEGSDTRRRADQILKHVIVPAVTACDFEALRADQISEPGLITTQVIQHIIEDPLVIADLTDSNPNVFYELAIRHAIRKPLVQIIEKDHKIPFDVQGMRTVPVDHRDLDSVQEAKDKIERQIKSTLQKKPEEIESPISVSVELQALRHSENPKERSLAEFVSAVGELRTDVASIDKRLSNPERLLPPEYVQRLVDLSGRRTSKEYEMMLREIMYTLDDLAERLQKKKEPAEELMVGLRRIQEMVMMMRHEMR